MQGNITTALLGGLFLVMALEVPAASTRFSAASDR